MKHLHFEYYMKLEFDQPVHDHRFTVKCIPQSDERQQIVHLDVDIYPNGFLTENQDSHGNRCIFGFAQKPHRYFSIKVSGRAKTACDNREASGDFYRNAIYRYETWYTRPGPCLQEFAHSFTFSQGATALEKASTWMERLYRTFCYEQGATTVDTTAEQAMELGKGVCQDYAHILISLCRMDQIPARYVVGMLVGEGASHAWVEVFQDGYWYGFDPTNGIRVGEQHVKISSGRDYNDCRINQGLFVGTNGQKQLISVKVEEMENDD
ncbi:MAG: transglutaminase family protein [Clostridiales bacterium]|nr:transglutaminase family protein [Clostridiales bacterium]